MIFWAPYFFSLMAWTAMKPLGNDQYLANLLNIHERLNLRSILRTEALKSVHRSLSLRVEVAGLAGASDGVGVALVYHHVDLAADADLGEDDGFLKELTLRTEVHAIVQTPGPLGSDELVTEAADVAVKGETLDINVSQPKDGQSRGVVAV